MSKKSFNLSLQKKRNQLVLNPIIDRCDADGSYVADKVVDYVEKALFFERSVGLSKAMNTYVLVKNTLASQYSVDSDELQQKVEDVMKSIISVDGERLAQFLSDPNAYSNGAGALPASENRSTVRSTPPAPVSQPKVERQEVEQRSASTATAVAEPEQENEEMKHQRIAEERALKRQQEREERRLAEEQSLAQDDNDDDEEDDNEGIEINADALNNF